MKKTLCYASKTGVVFYLDVLNLTSKAEKSFESATDTFKGLSSDCPEKDMQT